MSPATNSSPGVWSGITVVTVSLIMVVVPYRVEEKALEGIEGIPWGAELSGPFLVALKI